MRPQLIKSDVCGLCLVPTHENRLILASLAKKLKKLAHSIEFSQSQGQQESFENQGFARLLFALNLAKKPQKHYQKACLHQFWFKRIKKYLVCSQQKLDYLCHLAANVVSQKSYHFFLLEAQIKNSIATSCMIASQGTTLKHEVKLQERQDYQLNTFLGEKRIAIEKEKEEIQTSKIKGHGSFSTIQDFGSFVFDSGMGLWYQRSLPGDQL